MNPNSEELDFVGIWRDDQQRIVEIVSQREDGIWLGHFKDFTPCEYTKFFGINTKDGSLLMERKRGGEGGWD